LFLETLRSRARRCGIYGGRRCGEIGERLLGTFGNDPTYRCLQCGGLVAEVLVRLGSVLCHDCRELHGIDVTFTRGNGEDAPPTPPRGSDGEVSS
jgi:hypothetical protein